MELPVQVVDGNEGIVEVRSFGHLARLDSWFQRLISRHAMIAQ